MTGMGHNITAASLGMDPEVFMKHHAAMALARKNREAKAAELALVKREEKRVRKLFQADGGVQGDYDVAMQLRDESQAAAVSRIRRISSMGQLVGGLPSGVQLSIFDDVVPDPEVERAKSDGQMAGSGGDAIELNPHDPSVPQHQAWLDGWHEGRKYFEEAIAAAAAREAGEPEPLGPDDNDDEDDGEQPVTDAPLTRDDPDMQAAEAEAEADARLADDPGGFGDEDEAAA